MERKEYTDCRCMEEEGPRPCGRLRKTCRKVVKNKMNGTRSLLLLSLLQIIEFNTETVPVCIEFKS